MARDDNTFWIFDFRLAGAAETYWLPTPAFCLLPSAFPSVFSVPSVANAPICSRLAAIFLTFALLVC